MIIFDYIIDISILLLIFAKSITNDIRLTMQSKQQI